MENLNTKIYIAVLFIILISIGVLSTRFFPISEKKPENNHEETSSQDQIIDIKITSKSTGSEQGQIAARLHFPLVGNERYQEGAPVVIYGEGGAVSDGLINKKLSDLNDTIVITFIYPGGSNEDQKCHSDGKYDYRGRKSIEALRDVILFATGKKTDADGNKLGDYAPYNVLYNNVGFIGYSFGGNIGIAVAALEGDKIHENLKYIIQWETPVSSQIATRDLGRMLLKPITSGTSERGDYFNPLYISYNPLILNVNYSSLSYDPESIYPVFLDGNNDGIYTTIDGSHYSLPSPDLNDNGKLELDEDFGLDTYWYDTYDFDGKIVYSRPVTIALEKFDVFNGNWPENIATVEETIHYWNIRESVRLYQKALENIPDLKIMFLLSEDDHVQKDPHKSHVHQAYDGWAKRGGWFKINPSYQYLLEVDDSIESLPLQLLPLGSAPESWEDTKSYCIPEKIKDKIYCIAAIHEMADLVQFSN